MTISVAPTSSSIARGGAPASPPLSPLSSLLVLRGILGADVARQAARRERLYGGGLDTVLLEMGLVPERDLWAHLAQATGLSSITDAHLEPPDKEASFLLDPELARRFGAVPVRQRDDTIQMLGRPSVDVDALMDWGTARGLEVEIFVAPEVRFWAAFGAAYREAVPARFLSLLLKLIGPSGARQWARLHTPPRLAVAPAADTGPRPGQRIREPEVGIEIIEAAEIDEANDDLVPIVDPGVLVSAGHDIDVLLEIYELEPESTAGRTAAAKILQWVGPDSLISRLPDRVRRRPEAERALLRLVAGYGVRLARPVSPLLEHPDVQWRLWAVGILEFTDVTGPEPILCRLVDDDDEAIRRSALRALRRRLEHDKVRALTASLLSEASADDIPRARRAIASLGELRAPSAVPLLIEALQNPEARIATAAHAALVDITKQDFGSARWRWNNWERQSRDRSRVEWLLEALGHKSPELRLAASVELRDLTGEYMGYHFDLSRRDRDEALQRWWAWWEASGRSAFGRTDSA